MEITIDEVSASKFRGGQMEIHDDKTNEIYRGEVKTITVTEDTSRGKILRVQFAWFAKAEGHPPLPTGWVKNDQTDLAVDLSLHVVSNIGSSGGDVGGSDRICLKSKMLGETIILYPPDGSKLDPAEVRGLVLPPATPATTIVIRPFGEKYFTKKFGDGVFSDRVILPGPDGCRVKATHFYSKAGFEAKDICYTVDETVYVVKGRFLITVGHDIYELGPGSTYFVPAGLKYSVKVLEEGTLFCVFSQAGPNGPLPDDE